MKSFTSKEVSATHIQFESDSRGKIPIDKWADLRDVLTIEHELRIKRDRLIIYVSYDGCEFAIRDPWDIQVDTDDENCLVIKGCCSVAVKDFTAIGFVIYPAIKLGYLRLI